MSIIQLSFHCNTYTPPIHTPLTLPIDTPPTYYSLCFPLVFPYVLVGCSVSIIRDDGYLHTILAAALTGVVLLFAATTALLHVYRNHAIVVQMAALTGYIH